MRLRVGDRELELSGGPLLMGILNASPDSFSDPGPRAVTELVEAGRRMVAEGAALVDVGGESGRTDTTAVPEEEEIRRVVPVIEALAGEGVVVSVDTWRARVARAALDAGAALVNDVSGLSDTGVAEACAEHGAGLVVTHTRVPPKRKEFPVYDADVVADVLAFLGERDDAARRLGVAADRLVHDPGIDLGKTPAESVELLRRLPELRALGRPLLLAVSRKDFVGAATGRPPGERDAGTLAAVGVAADGGAAILRVHDVAGARDYLAVRAALGSERELDHLPEELRRSAEAAAPAC